MIKITKIVKDIRDEFKDTEKYYYQAISSTESSEKDTFKRLASQGLDNANKLHELAVILINDYKNSGKEVPQGMQAIWNFEHEKYIEEHTELQNKIAKIS